MSVASQSVGGQIPGFVTLATSGVVIPAVAGRRIRVYGWILNSLADTQVQFLSNAAPISALWSLIAKGGMVVPPSPTPWLFTSVGQSLSLSMTVNTTVGVQVLYDLS